MLDGGDYSSICGKDAECVAGGGGESDEISFEYSE